MLPRSILVLCAAALLATNGVAAAPDEPGYDIVLLAGQSNMAGRGVDDASPEAPDPRLFQFGGIAGDADAGRIMPGSGPLEMPEGVETGLIGPGPTFARAYLAERPPNRRVLLLPAAWGGTTLVSQIAQNDPACGTRPCWAPGDPGGVLFESAIAQANAAIAAAKAVYPASRFVGTLWIQGESDTSAPEATYAAALDALIAGFRGRIAGAKDSWFIVGGMLPEYVARSSGSVAAAHVDTPRRVLRTAYSAGAAGHVFLLDGLNLHFDAAGQRINGRRMFDAVARAEANIPGTPPVPPTLSAAPTPGSQTGITVSVAPPAGRVTDYLLEVSPHGTSSWVSVAHAPVPLAQDYPITNLKTGVFYDVRAASINALGRSASGPLASAAPLAVPGRAGTPRVETAPTSDTVTLAWAAPVVGTVSSYRVQYRRADEKTWVTFGSSADLAMTVSALKSETCYAFRVLAINGSGPGPASDPVSATTAPYTVVAPVLRQGRYLFDHEYGSGSAADRRGSSRLMLHGDAAVAADRISTVPTLMMTSVRGGAATVAPAGRGARPSGPLTCVVAGQPVAPVSSSGRYVLTQSVEPQGRIDIALSLVDPTTRWTARARGRVTGSDLLPTDGTSFVSTMTISGRDTADWANGSWPGIEIGFGPESGPVSLALAFDACMTGESAEDDNAVQAAFRAGVDREMPARAPDLPYRRSRRSVPDAR